MKILCITTIESNHDYSACVEWNSFTIGVLNCIHGIWGFEDWNLKQAQNIMAPLTIRTLSGAQKWMMKYLLNKGYIEEAKK